MTGREVLEAAVVVTTLTAIHVWAWWMAGGFKDCGYPVPDMEELTHLAAPVSAGEPKEDA